MSRILKLTDKGQLRFVDESGKALSLKCPESLAGDVSLELPSADGSAGQFLATDGSGKLGFASVSAVTITGSGTAGKVPKFTDAKVIGDSVITEDSSKIGIGRTPTTTALEVAQAEAGLDKGLRVYQGANHVDISLDESEAQIEATGVDELQIGAGSSPGRPLRVTADAVGVGLSPTNATLDVLRSDDGKALHIESDAESGSSGLVELVNAALTGPVLSIDQDAEGVALLIDKSAAGSENAAEISNAGTGAGLYVEQTGDGVGIHIAHTGEDAQGLFIDMGAGTTLSAIRIEQNGAGNGVNILQAGENEGLAVMKTADGAEPAARIENAGTGATLYFVITGAAHGLEIDKTAVGGGNCIDIDNDGVGKGIYVKQDGDAIGLHVDKDSSSADHALLVENAGLGNALRVIGTVGGVIAHFENDSGDNGEVLELVQASDDPVLTIENAGSGHYINTDAGAGTPAHLSNAGVWTDASCFREFKAEIEPVEASEALEKIERMEIARYYSKREIERGAKSPRRFLGPFQDDLVELFGLDDRGVVPSEIASIAILGVKALVERVRRLEAKAA